MFQVPTKLDHLTLRKIANHHFYKRILWRFPRLREAARKRRVFERLGCEIA